jgi:hypothetical protein
LRALVHLDPTFDARLKATYDAAMKKGLWKGKYAGVNHHEYFAEGVQSWFGNNRPPDHDHNHVDTREELIAYDPGLAEICRGVFGDTQLTYTKPGNRLHGHLAGYNPQDAPTFAWPERLKEAHARIRRDVQRRVQSHDRSKPGDGTANYKKRTIAGWQVHVSKLLSDQETAATDRALELLTAQLDEIIRVIPPPALAKLQEVPLWISPQYSGKGPTAEYHPDVGWLRKHGRDPAMAKCVEFSNVMVFEKETDRMPNFVLHELAHAYHDRVLTGGFGNSDVQAAYKKAKTSGIYARVERWHGNGKTNTFERAYAMNTPMEYFAECTEAYFGRNDFFPFTKEELQRHDPAMYRLLSRLWGVQPPQEN